MAITEPCPVPERWQKHLQGSLSSEEHAALVRHLDQCTTCQQTLEKLASGSGAWPGPAPAAGATRTHESGLHQVLEHLKHQQHGPETVAPGADNGERVLDFLTPSDQPGSLGRLGRYEMLEVVGTGGMGVVLKAHDESLRRIVAVKVMAPALAATGTARKRFVREAHATAAVRNDHVIYIHEVDDKGAIPYLVMEFIAGMTLQQKLDQEGPLPVKEILRIGLQIAAGLAAAHKQGLVHRDIKPSNILLENGVQRVKITDFGLARAVDDASLTQSGVIAGTPQYMAPEQAAGEAVDHRADLFSLGSVLYAMCTGHPPFRASGNMAVMKRVCEEMPRPIREVNPEIPEWLEGIIAKLHAKRREDRFQAAAELADLLGQHLAHLQQPDLVPKPALMQPTPAIPAANAMAQVSAEDFDKRKVQLVNFLAKLLPWIAMIVLWFPFSWQMQSAGQGASAAEDDWALHVEFGVFESLRLTWESSDTGFWLGFTRVHTFALILSIGLTLANLIGFRAARRQSAKSRAHADGQATAAVPARWRWRTVAGLMLMLALLAVFMVTGPWLTRFLGGHGTLALDGFDPALEQVTIRQGDTVIATLTQPWDAPVHLPPGKYELEFVCKPGFQVGNIFLDHTRYFDDLPPHFMTQFKTNTGHPGPGTSGLYSITIERGEYIRLVPSLEKATPKPAEKDGWVQLFNGKDLTGWKHLHAEQGEWKVVDGVLVGTAKAAGNCMLARDGAEYQNFHVRAQAKLGTGRGGISFRMAPTSLDGYHAPVISDQTGLAATGSLARFHQGQWHWLAAVENKARPKDDWVTLEVIAQGTWLTTKVNGVTTASANDAMFSKGVLALDADGHTNNGQPLPGGATIYFRNIEIKELLPAQGMATSQFTHGQHIDGWGEVTDPNRDCTFTADKEAVTITVPAGHHNLNPEPPLQNLSAPRVLQTVNGDFSAQVKVMPFSRMSPSSCVSSGASRSTFSNSEAWASRGRTSRRRR